MFKAGVVPARPGETVEGAGPAPRAHGILVVDDSPEVLALMGLVMRREGFAVWQAAGGMEAIDLYRSHAEAIDLVLMDVRMPGCDGPQTLAVLRAFSPALPCCFMSGDYGDYTEARLLASGAATVFQKPLRLAEVVRRVRELIPPDGPRSGASWTGC